MQNFFKNVSWLYRLHRWVSFLCAAFFLLLCITGLPLLFKDEISSLNSVENVPMQPMGYDALWDTVSKGQEQLSREYPGKIVKAISADAEKGQLLFRVENPGEMAGHARMKMGGEQLAFSPDSDSLFQHSQAVVRYPAIKDFMHFMHVLHLRLGFGQGGMVFLGIFCALSAFSVLTGLFLYWPMMKKISFGTVRDFSRSIFLADTHKFIGMIAGVWAFLLCVSGTMIVVFSLGYGAYLHGIDVKGSQQFAKIPMTQQRSLSEAMSWLEEQYPDRNLLSVEYPEKGKNYYAFYLTPNKAAREDFMGQKVLLSASTQSDVFYTQLLPDYLLVAAVFLDMHIHNHPTLLLKILWTCYLVLTIGTIISGLWVYFEKRRKHAVRTSSSVKVSVPIKVHMNNSWKWPGLIMVCSFIGMVAPLSLNPLGIIMGEIALTLPLIACLKLLKR
jgi:uncharacterized iron-regulated membrane protein